MSWLELSVPAAADAVDGVCEVLESMGAAAVTVRPDQGAQILEPAPGARPLARSNLVTGLFAADADAQTLLDGLRRTLGPRHVRSAQVKRLANEHWEQSWRQNAVAREFGAGLWVIPADAAQPAGSRAVVRLDPGLAFGTGAHPTTALCLAWLASIDLRGRTLLDFGCGSGVLAIAAALLGAREVHATDHDPQAVLATRDNAMRNGVLDRVHLTDDPPVCDVVVANILANALIALAPRLGRLVGSGGCIGLSGILPEQVDQVAECYAPRFAMAPPRDVDGWVLLTGVKS